VRRHSSSWAGRGERERRFDTKRLVGNHEKQTRKKLIGTTTLLLCHHVPHDLSPFALRRKADCATISAAIISKDWKNRYMQNLIGEGSRLEGYTSIYGNN